MGSFTRRYAALEWRGGHETVRIEPWGRNSLRIRGTLGQGIRDDLPGALLPPARRYAPAGGGSHHFGVLFNARDGERFHGPGRHQHGRLGQQGRQIPAGLTTGLSGIPWPTADIKGFSNGNTNDPPFRELIVRGSEQTGTDNEAWSSGDEQYGIIRRLLFLRERLRPYIMAQMRKAAEPGLPPMRPLFADSIPVYLRGGSQVKPFGPLAGFGGME
jgi:hypothetical protein